MAADKSDALIKDIGSALVASSSIPLFTNWADNAKTRVQAAPAAGSTCLPYRHGLAATARRIASEEGALALFTTGISASLAREAVTQVTRVGLYVQMRDALSIAMGGRGGGEAAVSIKMLTGLSLGALSALCASPLDLVRVRLQAEAGRISADGSKLETGLRAGLPPRLTGGLIDCIRDEVRARGMATLWRGVEVNVIRGAVIHCSTIVVYEHTKHVAKTRFQFRDAPSLHLFAGLIAGFIGTTVSMPLDVVRTRIYQVAAAAKTGSSSSSLATSSSATATAAEAVMAIAREGGPFGFFRGWTAAYVRLGPILVFYPALLEQVRKRVFGIGYLE